MRNLLSIKTYKHKDISVTVKIDYYNNKISIIDGNEYNARENKYKSFVFAERGVEYMNGWLNILDAIKFAVTEAKKDYEHELAETSKLKPKDYELILKPVIKNKK